MHMHGLFDLSFTCLWKDVFNNRDVDGDGTRDYLDFLPNPTLACVDIDGGSKLMHVE